MSKAPSPSAKTYPRPPADPVKTRVPFSFVHINKCGGSSIEIALGLQKTHQTAASMRAELGEADWKQRYKFAVVRNPFARVVSIYFYRVRTDQGKMGDRHVNVNSWIEEVWSKGNPDYRDGSRILFAPAFEWISQDGVSIVDHVARLENLREDWREIASTLGVSSALQTTNWNMHPSYRDVLSVGSRAILETAFKADLDHFDYAF